MGGVLAWVLPQGFVSTVHPRAPQSTLTATAAARWFPSPIKVGRVSRRDAAMGLVRLLPLLMPLACRMPTWEDPS